MVRKRWAGRSVSIMPLSTEMDIVATKLTHMCIINTQKMFQIVGVYDSSVIRFKFQTKKRSSSKSSRTVVSICYIPSYIHICRFKNDTEMRIWAGTRLNRKHLIMPNNFKAQYKLQSFAMVPQKPFQFVSCSQLKDTLT